MVKQLRFYKTQVGALLAPVIAMQYALTLGDYVGATLRMYDGEGHVIRDFDYHNKMCKMDGRLPHEVVQDNFTGT